MHQSWKQRETNASVMKNLGEVTSMCSQVQLRFKSITVVWVINASVFNQFLGRVFASLTRNILFWCKVKLSGSHTDAKKEVTSYYVSTSKVAGNNKSKFWKIGELTNPARWREMTVISRYVCTSSFWVRHSTQFQERLERTFRLSTYVAFDSRLICWICSFVFIMKRQRKPGSFFTPKKMTVEPQKH